MAKSLFAMTKCYRIVFLVILLLCRQGATAQWSQVGETLSKDCNASYAQMAVAPDGTPYIAYKGNAPEYVVQKFNGQAWEQVGHTGLLGTSSEFAFAIDKSGTPYLATDTNDYINAVVRSIVLKYDGSSWICVGDASRFTHSFSVQSIFLAFNAANAPCVSTGGKIITYNGTTWEQINRQSVPMGQIVAGAGGQLYTGIHNGLFYRYQADTTWETLSTTGLDSIDTGGIGLSASPDGTLYATFSDFYKHTDERMFKYDNNRWVQIGQKFPWPNVIDNPAFNVNGVPYAVYTDVASKLGMMRFNGGDWVFADSNGCPDSVRGVGYRAADAKGNIYVPVDGNIPGKNCRVLKYNTNADATAVISLPQNRINVYPVPALELLTIRNNLQSLNGTPALITDIQGRNIYRFTLGPTQIIETGQWAAGIYCLHLIDGYVLKIVKQ